MRFSGPYRTHHIVSNVLVWLFLLLHKPLKGRTRRYSSLCTQGLGLIYFFFLPEILFIYFYREGKEGEREEEKQENHWSVASHTPPTGNMTHNPGMCPDQESNW